MEKAISAIAPMRIGRPGNAAFSRSRIIMCDLLVARYQSDITLVSRCQYGPGRGVKPGSNRGQTGAKPRSDLGLTPVEPRFDPLLQPDSEVGDERQVVRGHQGLARAGELETSNLDVSFVINVVEMKDREDAGIGAASLEVLVDVDALEERAEGIGGEPAHP